MRQWKIIPYREYGSLRYKVQTKSWYWPFWKTIDDGFYNAAHAKQFIEDYTNYVVIKPKEIK